ncbi:MAG TPA: MBL fold metallo-hydrolase [Solirubrobacteraceae bacterium]|nr:MBL fold metallo-hydrolase [Solirubrobacteraceae bacterium]
MLIRVLGKSPSWQDAGGACSAYLVRQGGHTLLLDCGSGSFAKLRAACDYAHVDDVVISHMHFDHFADLVPFANGLCYGPRRLARPRLHLPPAGAGLLREVALAGGPRGLIDAAFQVSEYDPDQALELGPLRARFCRVPHFIASHAVRLTPAAHDGAAEPPSLTFSADTAPSEDLVRFAAGSELLLIEATLERPEPEGPRGHLTAEEAGEHARRAGARRVVLTHWSDELDAGRLRDRASAAFGAEVALAADGAEYVV